MNKQCKLCACRECLDNAEYDADGMCRNCDCCRENDFGFIVYTKYEDDNCISKINTDV